MTFNQYPRVMVHPHRKAAVWKTADRKGPGAFMEPETTMISPERFPDVTVKTLEQEKRYASLGYRPANCGDAAEYEQTVLESQPPDGYAFQAFPKWKYHATEMARLVQDTGEEAALGDGWGDAPIIATVDDLAGLAAQAAVPVEVPAALRSAAEPAPLADHERAELERLRALVAAAAPPPERKPGRPRKDASAGVDKRTKAYRDAMAAAEQQPAAS